MPAMWLRGSQRDYTCVTCRSLRLELEHAPVGLRATRTREALEIRGHVFLRRLGVAGRAVRLYQEAELAFAAGIAFERANHALVVAARQARARELHCGRFAAARAASRKRR